MYSTFAFLSPLCSYELKSNIQTVNEAAVCIYNAPITMCIYITQSQSLLKKKRGSSIERDHFIKKS